MDKVSDDVARVISKFNIPGWRGITAKDVVVKPLGDGYINTTYKVDKSSVQSKDGPSSLVFKKYGGNLLSEAAAQVFVINSPLVQSLISYETSKLGIGPKLYGVIDDCRVEEYVDSHPLTAAEAFQEKIMVQTARAFAKFHSIDLPLDRNREHFIVLLAKCYSEIKGDVNKLIDSGKASDECLEIFKSLLAFPMEEEYKWITTTVARIPQRQVLCSMDPNYLNRLVRNSPDTQEDNPCMIIDFDLTAYNDRGFDLGGHFVMREFDVSNSESNMRSGHPCPTRDEQRCFLTHYAQECEKLFSDWRSESTDSVDHLILEADAGSLLFSLGYLLESSAYYKLHDTEPSVCRVIKHIMSLYFELKEQFCNNYPNLAPHETRAH